MLILWISFHKYSLIFENRKTDAFLFDVNELLDRKNDIEPPDEIDSEHNDDEPNSSPIPPFKNRCSEPICKICHKVFKTISSCNYHERKSHKENIVFKCSTCKGAKAMKFLKNLQAHVLQYHGRQLIAKEKKAVVLGRNKETVVKSMFSYF